MPLPRALLLLLLIVVPFQGLAAVAVGQCKSLGQDQLVAQHAEHAAEGHDHPAHAHDDDGDESPANYEPCGPCSACCSFVGIEGPSGFVLPASASSIPCKNPPLPPPSVEVAGFDRPPAAL